MLARQPLGPPHLASGSLSSTQAGHRGPSVCQWLPLAKLALALAGIVSKATIAGDLPDELVGHSIASRLSLGCCCIYPGDLHRICHIPNGSAMTPADRRQQAAAYRAWQRGQAYPLIDPIGLGEDHRPRDWGEARVHDAHVAKGVARVLHGRINPMGNDTPASPIARPLHGPTTSIPPDPPPTSSENFRPLTPETPAMKWSQDFIETRPDRPHPPHGTSISVIQDILPAEPPTLPELYLQPRTRIQIGGDGDFPAFWVELYGSITRNNVVHALRLLIKKLENAGKN